MFHHPFACFSFILRQGFWPCNGTAGLTLFFSLLIAAHRPDGGFNLTQHGFSYVADRRAQMRERRERIEIADAGQIVNADVMGGFQTAACQRHKGDRVLCGFPEQQFYMRLIQFFQQAAVAFGEQHPHVIGAMILHRVSGSGQQRVNQFHPRSRFTAKRIFQRFNDSLRVRHLHAPQGDGLSASALRI
ncbi:hypothetical protein M0651_09625 [Paenibacillus sp. MBLB2552]|uniref:Uncharacterized protein n=2 Tax=Paenibacillus TaxID=44249 RepID=A0A9X2BT21_9BACL|nr:MULTISPECIES: hypothetical protein [Paenibacillaceae]MCK8487431.1 hypothetical protein [Paenibacillus mellifer]MCT1400875.1 hypothetical protein [Paenibacillus sp. p3-SID867]